MKLGNEDVLQDDGSLHVLGYGSLMWQPDFDFMAATPVWLHGWHRRFSLHSTMAWGSKEVPGLSLGIYPGGNLFGLVLHVSASEAETVLDYLDEREAAYHRANVDVTDVKGTVSKVMTYVPDPRNDRWRPDLTLEDQARLIGQGVGSKGSSRSYLERTVAFLEDHGHEDTDMHDLLRLLS